MKKFARIHALVLLIVGCSFPQTMYIANDKETKYDKSRKLLDQRRTSSIQRPIVRTPSAFLSSISNTNGNNQRSACTVEPFPENESRSIKKSLTLNLPNSYQLKFLSNSHMPNIRPIENLEFLEPCECCIMNDLSVSSTNNTDDYALDRQAPDHSHDYLHDHLHDYSHDHSRDYSHDHLHDHQGEHRPLSIVLSTSMGSIPSSAREIPEPSIKGDNTSAIVIERIRSHSMILKTPKDGSARKFPSMDEPYCFRPVPFITRPTNLSVTRFGYV